MSRSSVSRSSIKPNYFFFSSATIRKILYCRGRPTTIKMNFQHCTRRRNIIATIRHSRGTRCQQRCRVAKENCQRLNLDLPRHGRGRRVNLSCDFTIRHYPRSTLITMRPRRSTCLTAIKRSCPPSWIPRSRHRIAPTRTFGTGCRK